MRNTLNSFYIDFGCNAPANYARIASVSLITGIHLTDLENALAVASQLGTADVQGGDVNHVVDRIRYSRSGIRFRVYNRYETNDGLTDVPLVSLN